MRGLVLSTLLVAMGVVAGGCGSAGSPATTPAVTSTVPATTTTVAPTTSSTTTTTSTTSTTVVPSTSTTLDRVGEIEALFQDLEDRRLHALYEGDREAFRALFANDEYRDRSMEFFDLAEFIDGWTMPEVEVVSVLADTPTCIAATLQADYSGVLAEGDFGGWTEVLERVGEGWGISFAGEGWACDGPHPFSP